MKWGHSEFDFDTIAVDLLDRFNALRGESAPEGWLSIGDIASQMNAFKQAVLNTAKSLDIEATMLVGVNGYAGRYYSPEQAQQIIEEYGSVEAVLDEWQTVDGIARQNDIDRGKVQTAVKQLGITGKTMRSEAGRIGLHYTTEETAQILDHLTEFANKQEEWRNLNTLSELLPVSRPTVESLLKEMGIDSQMMKGPTGRLSLHYPPGTAEKLLAEYNKIPQAPEGWISGAAIAKEREVNGRRLTAAIDKTGVNGSQYRAANGKPALFYDPGEAERIRQAIQEALG